MFKFEISDTPFNKSLYSVNPLPEEPSPPSFGDFLLLDGENFLLLDGENFELL